MNEDKPTHSISPDSVPTAASGVPLSPADFVLAEKPGDSIGPYKLLSVLGEGGFGTVFMAEQTKPVARTVALKVIKLGMDTRQVVARFEQERQALALMDHPNIAKVFDAGATSSGRPYFVMELVRGDPIVEYCDRNQVSIPDRLELFSQVCSAIQHAHTKGIIHRDIKPSNIIVGQHEGKAHVRVIDFGIAKATASKLTEKTLFTEHRAFIGTPEYMSPEQAEGSLDIDTRTDVYALGVTLYELLTGFTPFSGTSLRSAAYGEIQRIIREVDPPKPSTRLGEAGPTLSTIAAKRRVEVRKLGTIVRGELDWIVMRAIEKDRSRRYESASALAADIQRYLGGQPVLAAPPSSAYLLRKFVRRHRGRVAAAGLLATALVLGTVGTSYGMVRATRSAESERAAKQVAEERRVEAEKSLGFALKGNQILGGIFDSLDPDTQYQNVAEFRGAIHANLGKAVAQLDGTSIGTALDVARMQNTLGRSFQRMSDPIAAAGLFEKALATFEKDLGPDHIDTLDARNNLAVAYMDSGRSKEALPLLELGQQNRERTQGVGNVDSIVGLRNLGGAYFSSGDYARAGEIARRALERARTSLGQEHPETHLCALSLGTLLIAEGKADEAIPILKDALDRQRAISGPSHPATLRTQVELANAYGTVGRGAIALPMLEDACDRAMESLGEGHAVTIAVTNQLGVIYWGMGRPKDAIPLFEKNLVHQIATSGPDSYATLTTKANLGVNYLAVGRVKEAVPLLEEVAKSAGTYPLFESYSSDLLDAYQRLEDYEKIVVLLDRALVKARKDFAPKSPDLASLLARLGSARLELKQWGQAEPLLRECLAIRQEVNPEDWTTFNTMSMLGAALDGQGKHEEAKGLLVAGYEGMRDRKDDIPAQARNRISQALDRLIAHAEATGDTDALARWKAESAAK